MVELLERYPKLHLYVDDAHGMSWCGTHGRGWVLSRTALLPRMIVATSLNKGFAAAGAALLVADPELRRRIATLGGPMLFCGPIQPPMLGAAVASARLHLSEELVRRQEALRDRVRLFNRWPWSASSL
jgi:7-keto-8-aminopelargonate synthetase-like enzyme